MRCDRLKGWVLLAVLATSSAIFAQSRPMPPDPYDPHAAPMPQQPAASAPGQQPQQTAPPGDISTASLQSNYVGPYDFPATNVNAIPPARAQQVVSRAVYSKAQQNLHTTVDNLYEDFNYSPQFQAALKDEAAAHDAYSAARDRALAKLLSNSEYMTYKKLAADLARKLEDLHQHPTKHRDEILATASVKLEYQRLISDMESAALADDAAVQSARSRLVDAGAVVADMRSTNKRAVRRDASFVAARNSMDNAKISFLGADAYYHSTVNVACVALDYAYWIHRYDPYNYYPWSQVAYNNYPYYGGYGGYGGGYSGGWVGNRY